MLGPPETLEPYSSSPFSLNSGQAQPSHWLQEETQMCTLVQVGALTVSQIVSLGGWN